jgi:hypothetical protein
LSARGLPASNLTGKIQGFGKYGEVSYLPQLHS